MSSKLASTRLGRPATNADQNAAVSGAAEIYAPHRLCRTLKMNTRFWKFEPDHRDRQSQLPNSESLIALARPRMANKGASPLRYRPLSGKRQIRLLCLENGNGRWCEDCHKSNPWSRPWEFVHVSLDHPPPYFAISYVWGNSRLAGSLDGHNDSFALLRNVNAILDHMLTTYEAGTHIWIDALCIDQSNIVEKAQQIQLMREVYALSIQVLAWLGECKDQALARTIDEINSHAKWHHESRSVTVDPWRAPFGCQCRRDRGRDALATIAPLLELPWFKRVWVFQEVVAGSCVLMVCRFYGQVKELLWDDLFLYLVYHNLLRFGDKLGTDSRTYGSSNACITAGHRLLDRGDKDHPSAVMPLQTLLVECSSNFQATDPRDRIYALLGLSHDISFQFLVPNYAGSINELFITTASLILTVRMIPTSYPFVLLSFAGIGRPRNMETLPSWVPDWTSAAQITSFAGSQLVVRTTHFEAVAEQANFDATSGSLNEVPSISEFGLLSVDGLIIDSVVTVGKRYPGSKSHLDMDTVSSGRYTNWGDTPEPRAKDFIRWISDSRKLAESVVPYSTGEPAEDLLWRTLIANLRQDFEPWSAIYGETCLPKTTEYQDFFASISGENVRTDRFRNFVASFEKHGSDRILVTTQNGYLALAAENTMVGDIICLILGAHVPFIIRPSQENGEHMFHLVGETYVHGMMHGEGLQMGRKRKIHLL